MTNKLYLHDSYLKSCTAEIVQNVRLDGKPGIILDNTVFYPTSGGQPHDTGTINDINVLDVCENTDRQIVHFLEQPIKGSKALCRLDWAKRFDHMQQHTGQHLLSQAFLHIMGANTLSFHLGEQSATIDVDKPDLSTATIHKVEDLCVQIIYENSKIRVHEVDRKELHRYPTRKPPETEDRIRIIEIKDFDFSPCGGTHCARTGEIGLIKIWRHENYKGGTRIHFKCGLRALHDYQVKSEVLKQLTITMSSAESVLYNIILKLKDVFNHTRRERDQFLKALMDYEADKLISESPAYEGILLISKEFIEQDMKAMSMLANMIIEKTSSTVILFGTTGQASARLLFQRSSDLNFDMLMLMQKACAAIDGRGGGKAHKAQGGGPAIGKLGAALDLAVTELKISLNSEQ